MNVSTGQRLRSLWSSGVLTAGKEPLVEQHPRKTNSIQEKDCCFGSAGREQL